MTGEHWIINSKAKLENAIESVSSAFEEKHYIELKIWAGQRTIPQNALIHAFFNLIDRAMTWEAGEAKRYCKLKAGMGILSGDPSRAKYTMRIREMLNTMEYEEQLEFMDFCQCTSLMTVEEETRFIEWMQVHFAKHRVILESKRGK